MTWISAFLIGLIIGWLWAKYYYTKGAGKPIPKKEEWDMYNMGG